jgi:hypothetical protein
VQQEQRTIDLLHDHAAEQRFGGARRAFRLHDAVTNAHKPRQHATLLLQPRPQLQGHRQREKNRQQGSGTGGAESRSAARAFQAGLAPAPQRPIQPLSTTASQATASSPAPFSEQRCATRLQTPAHCSLPCAPLLYNNPGPSGNPPGNQFVQLSSPARQSPTRLHDRSRRHLLFA